MSENARHEITQILVKLQDGKLARAEGANRVFEAVFGELRRVAAGLMRGERVDHTLQPTALVNEAYLRLVDVDSLDWQGRAHFFGIAARAMRQILIEHARRRGAAKRGGDLQRVTLHDDVCIGAVSELDVLAIEQALERLGTLDQRMARIVELRIYAGLTVEEVAHLLGVSERTVHGDWRMAKMWLARELAEGDPE